MKVRLLSVPHTGTRFAKQTLERAGIKVIQVHFDGDYDVSHIYERDEPVVISLRDKAEVIASWKRRGKYNSAHKFDESWEEMEDFMKDNDFLPLRVDDIEHRDEDLRVLGVFLGVELTADFSEKVGAGR